MKSSLEILHTAETIQASPENPLKYFSVLAAGLLSAVFFSMLFYGEKFLFWKYPLSALGAYHTPNGVSNTVSMLIYGAGFIFCSVVFLKAAAYYRRNDSVPFRNAKLKLCYMISAGFFLGIAPHDVIWVLHTIGNGIMTGMLWILIMIYLYQAFYPEQKPVYYMNMILLQVFLLPYAFLFAIDSDYRDIAQKFAFFGVFGILLIAAGAVSRQKNAG